MMYCILAAFRTTSGRPAIRMLPALWPGLRCPLHTKPFVLNPGAPTNCEQQCFVFAGRECIALSSTDSGSCGHTTLPERLVPAGGTVCRCCGRFGLLEFLRP